MCSKVVPLASVWDAFGHQHRTKSAKQDFNKSTESRCDFKCHLRQKTSENELKMIWHFLGNGLFFDPRFAAAPDGPREAPNPQQLQKIIKTNTQERMIIVRCLLADFFALFKQGRQQQRQQQAKFKAEIIAQCLIFGSCLTAVCNHFGHELYLLLARCSGVRRWHAVEVFNIGIHIIHIYPPAPRERGHQAAKNMNWTAPSILRIL